MAGRVLDTSIVLWIWHGKTPSKIKVVSPETARSAVRAWLRLFPDDGILTPIRLEVLGGTRSREELRWTDAFLDEFPLLDEGRVLSADWAEAARLARRVPRPDPRPRGAIDCLIRAIATRLHADVYTDDTGFPGG